MLFPKQSHFERFEMVSFIMRGKEMPIEGCSILCSLKLSNSRKTKSNPDGVPGVSLHLSLCLPPDPRDHRPNSAFSFLLAAHRRRPKTSVTSPFPMAALSRQEETHGLLSSQVIWLPGRFSSFPGKGQRTDTWGLVSQKNIMSPQVS